MATLTTLECTLPPEETTVMLFPDCCLGISRVLLEAVRHALSDSAELVLSIGCGSGRFEGLLLADGNLNLVGIEVPNAINKHLPRSRFDTVRGTHALYAEAIMATALIFVYPRPPELVARYVKENLHGALQKVMICTHRDDWVSIRASLEEQLTLATLEELPGTSFHEIAVALTIVSN